MDLLSEIKVIVAARTNATNEEAAKIAARILSIAQIDEALILHSAQLEREEAQSDLSHICHNTKDGTSQEQTMPRDG